MSEARSHEAPWEQEAHARRKKLPKRALREKCLTRSAEAVAASMKRYVLRSSRMEPKLREAPTR